MSERAERGRLAESPAGSPTQSSGNLPVIVIGAGLSGLACAHRLRAAGREVRVLEAAPRAGGVAGTEEQDGFLFERGPNTLQASARNLRELCGELGIADRLVPSDESAKMRYLWFRGRLTPLPGGPGSLFTTPLLTWGGRLRLLSEPFRRSTWAADQEPEPTLAAFFEERLGPEPAARFVGAFVRGVYAGDYRLLGARSAFPRLWELVTAHGGILRGMRHREKTPPLPGPDVRASRLLSFPRGIGELVDGLAASLGRALELATPATALARDGSGAWCVRTADGERRAAAVVLAVPPQRAAELVSDVLTERSRESLAGVECASVTVVHLGFAPGAAPQLLPGFGYLVPPSEEGPEAPRVLGTIFVSNLFADRAPGGGATVTTIYAKRTLEGLGEAEQVRAAREDLDRALAFTGVPEPAVSAVRTWTDAIPQYTVGHADRMQAVLADCRESAPGLHLAGNATGGIGVEQVIARGREVAAALLEELPA